MLKNRLIVCYIYSLAICNKDFGRCQSYERCTVLKQDNVSKNIVAEIDDTLICIYIVSNESNAND